MSQNFHEVFPVCAVCNMYSRVKQQPCQSQDIPVVKGHFAREAGHPYRVGLHQGSCCWAGHVPGVAEGDVRSLRQLVTRL